MILVDISQIFFTNVNSKFFIQELDKGEYTVTELLRNMTFAGLAEIRKKFSNYASSPAEMIICCDDTKSYWRRDIFPHYKVKRKAQRNDMMEKYNLDWELIYKVFADIRTALRENFQFPIIEVDGVEADDIIASYCYHNKDKKIMIYSSDGDFKQLLWNKNVAQYSPRKEDFVKMTEDEIIENFVTKLIKGDTKDSIPNILSPDDIFVNLDENGKAQRQKSITKNDIRLFIANGKDACVDDFQRANFERNEKLIDFRLIPSHITDRIMSEINSHTPKGTGESVYAYLMEQRMLNTFENEIKYF